VTPEELAAAKQRATSHGYVRRVLLGLDLFANVVTGGKVGETISARSQRAADRGNWAGKAMTGFLHLFQRDHGHLAEIGDEARAEAVEQTEQKALDLPPQ
jgi:hypothetical protein